MSSKAGVSVPRAGAAVDPNAVLLSRDVVVEWFAVHRRKQREQARGDSFIESVLAQGLTVARIGAVREFLEVVGLDPDDFDLERFGSDGDSHAEH